MTPRTLQTSLPSHSIDLQTNRRPYLSPERNMSPHHALLDTGTHVPTPHELATSFGSNVHGRDTLEPKENCERSARARPACIVIR